MLAEVEKIENFLKQRQIKLTQERKLIIDEMLASQRHFGPEELWEHLRQKGKRVSRATVYRTLELLIEGGLVKKVCLGEHCFRYEHILGRKNHSHMVCLKCGALIEFLDEAIDERQKLLSQQQGFEVLSRCFQIFGYCKNCTQ